MYHESMLTNNIYPNIFIKLCGLSHSDSHLHYYVIKHTCALTQTSVLLISFLTVIHLKSIPHLPFNSFHFSSLPIANTGERCLPITALQNSMPSTMWVKGAPITEFFYNFRFVNGTAPESIFKAAISGRKHHNPETPPMVYFF